MDKKELAGSRFINYVHIQNLHTDWRDIQIIFLTQKQKGKNSHYELWVFLSSSFSEAEQPATMNYNYLVEWITFQDNDDGDGDA